VISILRPSHSGSLGSVGSRHLVIPKSHLLQYFDTVGWVFRTVKNRRPYNLYCVGADVKPCSINQHKKPRAMFVTRGWRGNARRQPDMSPSFYCVLSCSFLR